MKRGIQEVSYDFTISNISFPTIPNSKFRLISSWDADQENVAMKIEKLKSTQQWELSITDITKHGPSGLPQGAIFKGLKTAFEKQLVSESDEKATNLFAENDPQVKAVINSDGSFSLTLVLPLMGFPVEFLFVFHPVVRERIDILETALRDAEEEVDTLKNELATIKSSNPPGANFVSLTSSNNCQNEEFIVWDEIDFNSNPLNFEMKGDKQALQIKSSGLYQIWVSSHIEGEANYFRAINLYWNDSPIATANSRVESGFHSTIQVVAMYPLTEEDELSVSYLTKGGKNVEVNNDMVVMKINDAWW